MVASSTRSHATRLPTPADNAIGARARPDSTQPPHTTSHSRSTSALRIERHTLKEDAEQQYYLVVPSGVGASSAPLLATVHGISRNAAEHACSFAPLAQKRGVVVLAPVFARTHFPDYQRLGRNGRGRRADLALDAMVDEVRSDLKLTSARLLLFGHSGGGQFVHRYAMAHPGTVERYVVSAAGWYTLPDPSQPYPAGIGYSAELPDLMFDADAFLRVPGCVLVGEQDVRRGKSLRTASFLDEIQGSTRLERGRRWIDAMNAACISRGIEPRFAFRTLARANHRFQRMVERGGVVAAALEWLCDRTAQA